MKSPDAGAFVEEAAELLPELEQALLELEQGGGGADGIDRVFRAMHTLKGSGGMFGFHRLAEVAHDLESLFDRVRSGELACEPWLVDLGLRGTDLMRSLLDAAGTDRTEEERRLREELRVRLGSVAPTSHPPPEPRESALRRYRIRFRPFPDILATGTNPLSLLDELRGLGEATVAADFSALPPLDRLDPIRCHLAWEILLETTAPPETIREVFIFVEEGSGIAIEEVAPAPSPRVPRKEAPPGWNAGAGRFVRVPSEKLDRLVDLVGEMVTLQARLSLLAPGLADADAVRVAEGLEKLTWEMREQILSVRMIRIGTMFGSLRRLVRDLGRELGKDVELAAEGGETELDKTVVERLHDPLVHLIRNALDHGIESPETRTAAGKPVRGTVRVTARQAGGSVEIVVADDGRGIDREKVLSRHSSPPGEGDLLEAICRPGFSTSSSVTTVSGRGVGMDVVKRGIEALRGTLGLATRPGTGTEFVIRLPLTLAIIDGLMVGIGGERFIIPLDQVEECLEIRGGCANGNGGTLVGHRGGLLPCVPLRGIFGSGEPRPEREQAVVTRVGDSRFGLVVDRVVGEHQTVIKGLGAFCGGVPGISGATVLGDGSLALILDPQKLFEAAGTGTPP